MFELYLNRKFATIFVVLAIVTKLNEANEESLRGVAPNEATRYSIQSGKSWVCLDNRKTIKYEQVNDDYCDCADGSDEPGTSACPNGHFGCANIGHRTEIIQSTRVNDGICDCCDGSDEWADATGKCANTCLERERIEEEQKRSQAELQQLGGVKRTELIAKGKQIRQEREELRQALLHERNAHEAIIAEKEELKRNAEAAEAEALEFHKAQQQYAGESTTSKSNSNGDAQRLLYEAAMAFVQYDKNEDGFIDITELMLDQPLIDRDRNGIVSVEEAKYFFGDDERIDLNTFCTLSWPRIKSIKMLNEDIFQPPVSDDSERTEHEAKEQQPSKEKAHDHVSAKQVSSNNSFNANDEAEIYEDEESAANAGDPSDTTPEIEYDPETQRLIDLANEARNVYSAAQQKVQQIEQEIKNIDEQVGKDYGLNDEFATLDGHCFAYEVREYVYELCPFMHALQKPKSGGLETILGHWDQWLDGGDVARKYKKQKYAHGAACWHGPKRSCIVHFICGLEQKITAVSEPNRCEYHFVFETPAACSGGNAEQQHDEL